MIQPIFSQPLSFRGGKQKLINKGEDMLKKYTGFGEPTLEIKRVCNSKEDLKLMQKINHEMQRITQDFKKKSFNSAKNAENVILD